MRIGTLFSGIGAPEQAAKRVYGDSAEIVFACEYDKFARQSFSAMYGFDGEHFHNDVHDMDGTQYRGKVDILIGGSPCQSFSVAGLREGTDDKRGQLIYQYIRIAEEVKPPIIIYENVRGLLSIDHGRTFKEFVQALRDIGYHCHHEVINTKDHGVPQNRERIFVVGFLDSDEYHNFHLAPKKKLSKSLKNLLEDSAEEKYYLNNKMVNFVCDEKRQSKKYTQLNGDIAICQQARQYANWNGDYIKEGVVGKLDIKGDYIKRVYGTDGVAPCLPTMQGGNQEPKILQNEGYRVRKLTPLECWRLQDFSDEAFLKAKNSGVSDSQLYKQAGNSMSVNVVAMIFESISAARNNLLRGFN